MKQLSGSVILMAVFFGCSPTTSEKTGDLKQDTTMPKIVIEKEKNDSLEKIIELKPCANDSLNAIADIISGIADSNSVYNYIQDSPDFKAFNKNFDKRWISFDSSRLANLRAFKENEIS